MLFILVSFNLLLFLLPLPLLHLLLPLHLLLLPLLPLQSVGGAEHYCLPATGTQLPPLPLSTNERLSLPTLQWEEAPLV